MKGLSISQCGIVSSSVGRRNPRKIGVVCALRSNGQPSSSEGNRSLSNHVETAKRAVATLGAALVVGGALTLGDAAFAVTTEQLLFLDGWRAVDRAYVDKGFNGQNWFQTREKYLKNEPMNNREETYAAIRKLVASLNDPFTRFLEPEKLASIRRGSSGNVTGVGLELGYGPAREAGGRASIVVISPTAGGPADRAGVRPGDVIASVSGQAATGLSLYEVSDLLRGAEGTDVSLTVLQGGLAGPTKDVTLTRQKIVLNPVTFKSCGPVGAAVGGGEGELGYIRLSTFNGKSKDAFLEALTALQEKGTRRIVIDLRNNGGGLFPAAVEIGRMLIDKGDIVLIADNQGVRDIYSAEGRPVEKEAKVAVLVNKGTASAAEVLAGALKDNGRAVIVGENTFGKGLIQTVIDLPDGSGLAVTVAKYQTPAGIDINKVGVTPNLALDTKSIPFDGDGFCALVTGQEAPKLFLK